MKVLLTGSAGFVGRHLHEALYEDDVTCIDVADGHDCIDFFRQDLTRYDLAIHCAATIGGRTAIDGSPLAVATNLALDALYFRWLEQSGTRRAVYFSSSAAYPVILQRPHAHRALRENDINHRLTCPADATYGLAKITGEQLAEYAAAAGCRILIPRPFSGYGEDQALDYPFPSFIDRAVRRCDPFQIWGDGTQTRDFIHIDDIVAAVLTMLDQGVEGPVNLGTGIATSFNDLARLVCDIEGYEPRLQHFPAAPTGVAHRVADPSLMLRYYEPTITLEQGVDRALAARKVLV